MDHDTRKKSEPTQVKTLGNFVRKSVWWTKGISRTTACTLDVKLELRKCPRLYMWNDRKDTEMDTSYLNTRAVWDSSTIHSTCVSGTLPKSFSFFYLLKARGAVPWCMLWMDVLDTADKSLGNGVERGEQDGRREMRFQERKGESYIEKKPSQKKSIQVFTRAAETHAFSPGTVTRSHPEGVEHLSAQRTNPVRKTEVVHFSLNYAKLSFPIMMIFAASAILEKPVRFPPCWKTHMRHPITGEWTLTLPKFCEL